MLPLLLQRGMESVDDASNLAVLLPLLVFMALMIGIVLLLYYVLQAGGGYANIMDGIAANHPEMLTPLSDGNMPVGLYLTQWILVGICTIALPQSVVRGISYKDTKSLHHAMLIGTIVIGFMNIGVNFTGILAHGVLDLGPEAYGGKGFADNIIPLTVATALPRMLAGIAIIGPLAASISTISGLLIVASSAIVKDVYLHYAARHGKTVPQSRLRHLSMAATGIIGVVVFLIALTPPALIWLINMFAFGGLETAFFWTLLLGLFWERANKLGALLSMGGGTIAYCAAQAMGFKFLGLHQIVIGITVSLVFFLIGSYAGKPAEQRVLDVFFPKD